MANLQQNIDNDQPQRSSSSTLDMSSSKRERARVNDAHFQEIASHLLDGGIAVNHGHAVGHSGAGHPLPRSDAHMQANSYVPQGILSREYAKDGGAHAS